MTPLATVVDEEGILIDNFRIVSRGKFQEAELHTILTDHAWPARNPHQNIADLKAQIAANEKGVAELRKMVAVSYTHLDVYKRQFFALRTIACAHAQTMSRICRLVQVLPHSM